MGPRPKHDPRAAVAADQSNDNANSVRLLRRVLIFNPWPQRPTHPHIWPSDGLAANCLPADGDHHEDGHQQQQQHHQCQRRLLGTKLDTVTRLTMDEEDDGEICNVGPQGRLLRPSVNGHFRPTVSRPLAGHICHNLTRALVGLVVLLTAPSGWLHD